MDRFVGGIAGVLFYYIAGYSGAHIYYSVAPEWPFLFGGEGTVLREEKNKEDCERELRNGITPRRMDETTWTIVHWRSYIIPTTLYSARACVSVYLLQ